MKIYYYVRTGHRVGLDRFRRAAALVQELDDIEITLLTSDFRIASAAKEFGIKKAVGIDVARNIPQIAERGSVMLFDSDEHNDIMLEEMTAYFSLFIRFDDDPLPKKHPKEYLVSPYIADAGVCGGVPVANEFFAANRQKDIERLFFFGDDDYEKRLVEYAPKLRSLGCACVVGFYYFFDYETELERYFERIFESESYADAIKRAQEVITSSPQCALESSASGARVVYVQREDYPDVYKELLRSLGIAVVDSYDMLDAERLRKINLSQKYNKLGKNVEKVGNCIRKILNL